MIELHDVVDLWYRKSLCNGNCSQIKLLHDVFDLWYKVCATVLNEEPLMSK